MTSLSYATRRSRETVSKRLADAGVKPKLRGRYRRYPLRPAIAAILGPELERAGAPPSEKPAEVLNLAAERARLAHEQSRSHALKNAETEGRLVDADAAAKAWADHITNAKRRLRAIPRQMASVVSGFTPAMAVQAQKLIDEALSDLARTSATGDGDEQEEAS